MWQTGSVDRHIGSPAVCRSSGIELGFVRTFPKAISCPRALPEIAFARANAT
ncbi:hypothetical protein [Xanthomonas oryzae]|uniref:hypothetical protein n=1 Tax=Xanthomonas oryzae TaxID=347 RepID=UPI000ABDDBB6|nr:hypothetical protein [Xanthomonas oryzae]